MGISFDQNISLCLKSDTKIVHFKVNFVFFQAKQQKYAFVLVGETNKTANIGFLYASKNSSWENLYKIGKKG